MDDITTLRAALAAAEARARAAETRATDAEARAVSPEAHIAHLKHLMRGCVRTASGHQRNGDDACWISWNLNWRSWKQRKPKARPKMRRTPLSVQQQREITGGHPLPADLPRERVVLPAPTHCPCCGETRLSKLGESITETLEVIPRQFKVIQTVREKFTCRDSESITQPPVPFYPISRGHAGPKLLAGILCDKYLQHLLLIRVHVLAAGRLHADDTTVPVLAKGRTVTGRLWNYVRDNHPFGGTAPPAVWFRYSRDRKGEHPVDHLSGWTGIVQSDAYAGYNALAKPGRQPAPVVSAGCCSKLQKRTKPPLP